MIGYIAQEQSGGPAVQPYYNIPLTGEFFG